MNKSVIIATFVALTALGSLVSAPASAQVGGVQPNINPNVIDTGLVKQIVCQVRPSRSCQSGGSQRTQPGSSRGQRNQPGGQQRQPRR